MFYFCQIFHLLILACQDDYIGRFSTTVTPGAKEAEIVGSVLKRHKGTFWLKVYSQLKCRITALTLSAD